MGYQTMPNSPDKYITAKNFFLDYSFKYYEKLMHSHAKLE